MKKRFLSWLLVLIMLAAMFVVVPATVRAQGGITIKLYYEREDGEYADWTVWMWALGAEGASYSFTEEDGKMVATANFNAGTEQVGYIVRRGNWAEKDIEIDQFLDLTGIVAGTVHAFVTSGIEGAELVMGDDVVQGIVVKSAKADGDVIIVETTAALTEERALFAVADASGAALKIIDLELAGTIARIKMEGALDLTKKYTLTFEDVTYNVNMPNPFSTASFEEAFTYTGDDLGATWTVDKTLFRIWAPTAISVRVKLYESGDVTADDFITSVAMTPDVNGTWVAEKEGDLNGVYYTYEVEVDGTMNEACDPYARAVGVNGERAMVINLASTNPEGWEHDVNPNAGMNVTDMVIYELHVRDFSFDESSGMVNKGKYLAFTELGTKNVAGRSTGVDYLRDLGITHLHLLPVFDFGSIDESKLDTDQFNWGYDPKNYNAPDGSYSTDPFNGEVRINEFKQMVQSLHNNGISVVMDVVYNHTYNTQYCFNKIVPGYFYRINENGSYSSGSGCGNDVASERAMVRKFIVDSVLYWVNEYHIDGFRFDLVGLIDIDTMNEIRAEVNKIDPSIIIYGEGWTMGTTVTKAGVTLSTQPNSSKTPGIAYFSDNIRDALKGSVFNAMEKGYVNGSNGRISEIRKGIFGAPSWAVTPSQVINYTSCHDNLTLWDKIASSNPDDSFEDRVLQNKLAAAIVFTAQGIPLMHAGEELLRTKVRENGSFEHNSYASSSDMNSIKWDDLNDRNYQQVHAFYKGLIELRKAKAAFRMMTPEEATSRIELSEEIATGVIAFTIDGGTDDALFVVYNPNREAIEVELPEGEWYVFVNENRAGFRVLDTVTGTVAVAPISCIVLGNDKTDALPYEELPEIDDNPDIPSEINPLRWDWIIGVGAGIAVAIAVAVVLISKKTKAKKKDI
ncbi:MAG: type I pullulanase [Clostridiales bacterium]|nr:type I pullulanase [Clostridiales bacterium]